MPLHDQLKTLAKLVAKDVKAGKQSARSQDAFDFMESHPYAVLEAIDLVHREANRKRPNDSMIQAYGYMFWCGLEALRYQIERGQDWAEEIVDAVRDQLLLLAQGEILASQLLLFLVNGLIEAKLEPGPELRQVLGDAMTEPSEELGAPDPKELPRLLEAVANETGGDEFTVYNMFAETSQALPAEFRGAIIEHLLTSEHPVLRDTAVLYLLDPDPIVRQEVCQAITRHASPERLSSHSLRRMIALRNWLTKDDRAHLDKAIKKARQKGVECASWPQAKIDQILASGVDGAGAQSLFAVVRQGRRYKIASLLGKQGVGIADAWIAPDQKKAEVKDLIDRIYDQTTAIPIGSEFLLVLMQNYLAIAQDFENVPPAGLLEFIETVAIETPQPNSLCNEELIELVEQSPQTAQIETAEVVNGDIQWFSQISETSSWFEDDLEVRDLIESKPRSRHSTKINLVIKEILEPRRQKWTERFLWTSLLLQQRDDLLSPWPQFLAIGKALNDGVPIKDIAVMKQIADTTVRSATSILF